MTFLDMFSYRLDLGEFILRLPRNQECEKPSCAALYISLKTLVSSEITNHNSM